MKTKHPLIPNPLLKVHFNTPLSSLFAPEHLKRLALAALPKPNCITAWNSRTWQIQPAKEVLLQRSHTFLVMQQCLFRTWPGIFPLIKTFNNGMHDQTSWGKRRYRIYKTINTTVDKCSELTVFEQCRFSQVIYCSASGAMFLLIII